MNKKQVFGTITLLGTLGFTAYVLIAYKRQQKLEEAGDGIITAEEARAMVSGDKWVKKREEHKAIREGSINKRIQEEELSLAVVDEFHEYSEKDVETTKEFVETIQPSYVDVDGEVDMDEVHESIRDTASWNASFGSSGDKQFEHRVISMPSKGEVIDGYDPMEHPLVDYILEGAKVLLYEADSIEARDQYIRMELAEWMRSEENYDVLLDLFTVPFVPKNNGDRILLDTLLEYRFNFFGESRWVDEVSMADVLLHYGRLATFNLDEDVRYWVDYFLSYNEFTRNQNMEQVIHMCEGMMEHNYWNEELNTYGFFGLNDRQWEEAHLVAQRDVDKLLTFQIEFNEFMKAYI